MEDGVRSPVVGDDLVLDAGSGQRLARGTLRRERFVRHLVTRTVPHLHTPARYRRGMSKQYLILIEDLVREGRSEREIDQIVREVVAEDERHDGVDDDTASADLPAAA
jgi:hypothetical protein